MAVPRSDALVVFSVTGDLAFKKIFPALLAVMDAVEDAGRIVDPILNNVTPLYEYEPSTWGPAEVDRSFTPKGGWHDPEAKAKCD